MKLTRRSFSGLCGMALLALVSGFTGCGFVNDVLAVLPTVLSALGKLMAMIQNAGIVLGNNVLAIVGDITTLGADLIVALKAYKAMIPGTTLQDIDNLLNAFLAAFENLLGLLPPLPGAIIGLVLMGIQIILGTIQGFVNQQPAPQMAKSRAKLAHLGSGMIFQGKKVIIPPTTNPSNGQFRRDFNGIPNLPPQYHV